MKSVGQLFEELGFNKEASESTQKAFVKHLLRTSQLPVPASNSKEKGTSPSFQKLEEKPDEGPVQLSFDLGEAS